MCVHACVCVRARARACVCVCVCVFGSDVAHFCPLPVSVLADFRSRARVTWCVHITAAVGSRRPIGFHPARWRHSDVTRRKHDVMRCQGGRRWRSHADARWNGDADGRNYFVIFVMFVVIIGITSAVWLDDEEVVSVADSRSPGPEFCTYALRSQSAHHMCQSVN